jgi:hypothetical protein
MTKRRLGETLSLRPPEGESWTWQTNTMLGSITYRALGIAGRQIIDFLKHEHACHAGKENGNLAAPYRQLEQWGVTAGDVRKGFAEVIAAGFVQKTRQGLRQAGGGEPSRFALTWLPTHFGSVNAAPPTHDWRRVIKELGVLGIGDVRSVRAWLRREVAEHVRGQKKKSSQPLICERDRPSLDGRRTREKRLCGPPAASVGRPP